MLGELAGLFKERGCEESLAQQQINRVRGLERKDLIMGRYNQESQEKENRVPIVPKDHPRLSTMMIVFQKLYAMIKSTEEHRKVFSEPPLIALRRCKNGKNMLVRSKVYNEDSRACDSRGYSQCDKSRCQVLNVMYSTTHFLFL